MRALLSLAAFGLLLLAGCTKSGGEERYIPTEASARQALESALSRWRDGQAKPEKFTQGKVAVEVLDQIWLSGQKLVSFEILSEESPAGGPRVFSVKLKTARGEQTVKYYVVGIDPLWIYSEVEYRKMTGG